MNVVTCFNTVGGSLSIRSKVSLVNFPVDVAGMPDLIGPRLTVSTRVSWPELHHLYAFDGSVKWYNV